MAKNLLNKYVWLVETIYKAGSITVEELNEKWLDNDKRSRGQVIDLFTKKSMTCPSDLGDKERSTHLL